MAKSKKLRVAVLFGGRSSEHEVSVRSARSVVAAMDKNKYEPVLIGIDKSGKWLPERDSVMLLASSGAPKTKEITVPELSTGMRNSIDAVFPVLHGSYGEDGTMQGFLKLAGVPFVGPSVLGSAVGMDKDVTKRLLQNAGIKVAEGVVFKKHEIGEIRFSSIKKKFGLPLFVKPANAGSSVGVSKVRNEKEFNSAIENAFKFDTKLLIEKFVPGREIECAVLGNEKPEASVLGEIIPGDDFYSYDDKYAVTSAYQSKIPAEIPKKIAEKMRQTAVKAYEVLCLEGMTRVDFFLLKDGTFLINEVNTIPGFTSISMYPKLWEATGISYPKLIDKLITLAISRFKREMALKTSV